VWSREVWGGEIGWRGGWGGGRVEGEWSGGREIGAGRELGDKGEWGGGGRGEIKGLTWGEGGRGGGGGGERRGGGEQGRVGWGAPKTPPHPKANKGPIQTDRERDQKEKKSTRQGKKRKTKEKRTGNKRGVFGGERKQGCSRKQGQMSSVVGKKKKKRLSVNPKKMW